MDEIRWETAVTQIDTRMSEETYIVVAIDGTSSKGFGYSGGNDDRRQVCVFNESSTRAFHRRALVPDYQKYFHHGPDSQVTGSDCTAIEQAAWDWLRRRLEYTPLARVVLVGHSRGGHIVTKLAIRLSKVLQGSFVPTISAMPPSPASGESQFLQQARQPIQPIHFLGLFDAVDMTYALGNTIEVPPNVVWFYHALRSKQVGSRAAWGNTATRTARIDNDHYFQRKFAATHGAIGGALPEACSGTIKSERMIGFLAAGVLGKLLVENASGSCEVDLSAEQNTIIGRQANEFITAGAIRAGIPLSAK